MASNPEPFGQTIAQSVVVPSYSYYVDQLGALNVVGEIQNVGSGNIVQVILSGTVFSKDGSDQADSVSQPLLQYMVPQQIAPFDMVFSSPNNSPDGSWYSLINAGEISNVTFAVDSGNETTSYQYPYLVITSSSSTISSDGAFLINGIIQNTGNQTATNLNVVGEFFNAAGTVVGVGYTDYLTPASLSPSENVSFQISGLDLNQSIGSSDQKIASYSLQIQAEQPILQGTAPAVILYHESASQSGVSSTTSPTLTPKSNSSKNSSNLPIIAAVAIVIVVLAVVISLVILRMQKPSKTVKQRKKERNRLTKSLIFLKSKKCVII